MRRTSSWISSKAEYYEGLCSVAGLPAADHAWVVYKGRVLDLTLEAPNHDPEVVPVYLGLPVPTRFFTRVIWRTGACGPVGPLYYRRTRKKG